MTVQENLRRLLEERGWKAYRLAKEAGLATNHVAAIMAGGIQDPRADTLRKLADALGVPVDQLTGSNHSTEAAASILADHDEPRELHGRWVPVEAVVVGGYRGEAGELKDEMHFLLNRQDPTRRGKVIRLLGDSMDPELRSGDLLLVDPKAPFTNGSIAVARINGESTVKKVYKVGAGKLRLEPINPEYKAEEVRASDVTIVGLVTDLVERKMR